MVEKMSFQTIAENSSVQPVSPQRCGDVSACAVSSLCPVYFSSSATLRIPTKRTLFSPTNAVQGSSEVEFLPAQWSNRHRCCNERNQRSQFISVMLRKPLRNLVHSTLETISWQAIYLLVFLTHCGQLKTLIGISFQYRPSVKPSFSNRH